MAKVMQPIPGTLGEKVWPLLQAKGWSTFIRFCFQHKIHYPNALRMLKGILPLSDKVKDALEKETGLDLSTFPRVAPYRCDHCGARYTTPIKPPGKPIETTSIEN